MEAKEKSLKESPEGETRTAIERELSVLKLRKERLDKVIASRESKAAKDD